MTLVYGSLGLTKVIGNHYWPELKLQAPPEFYCLPFWPQLGVLVVLAMTGVAMGLLLSACVSNPDQANALLPYVLIPQIVLGGGILPIKFPSIMFQVASVLSPVYWGYRAIHLNANTLPSYYPFHAAYEDSQLWPCLAMLAQMVVMLLLTAWFLRRKDPDKS